MQLPVTYTRVNSSSYAVNHGAQKKIRRTDMSSAVQGKLERTLRRFKMMSELSADNNRRREETWAVLPPSLAPVPAN